MKKISKQIIKCLSEGGTVFACGNGGSACQSDHFVAELVCSFENKNRPPLRAISLTSNTAILTAWSNDFTFDDVFARQIEALMVNGDILVIFSTSGKSKNCQQAHQYANDKGCDVIEFPRKGKGTAQIQEWQLKEMHQICREIERAMFP